MNFADKLRKCIHPILLKALPKKNLTVRLINEVPRVKGNKIYVMNHLNKHDASVACAAIKEHVFILARNAKVPIIPLVAEYTIELCMVKFGRSNYINHDADKAKAIQHLADVMATLKWEICESLPIEKRSERLKDGFDMEMRKRVAEYPKLNLE